MRLFSSFAALFRNLFAKKRVEDDLAAEVRAYLELASDAKVRSGLDEVTARQEAALEMGGVEQLKERVRAARTGFYLDSLLADVRYGWRALRRKPGFTLTAILVLALGLGATTAILTIAHGILLQALPYPEPQQLVAVGESSGTGPLAAVPYENYRDWRATQDVFAEMSARLPAGGVITGRGEPERVFGRWVSASFFVTLGVAPGLGRYFSEAEDRAGGEPVIVVSDSLFRRYFGGDRSVIGESIQFNGASWTLIGVTPSDFDFLGRTNPNNDFFVPLGQLQQVTDRGRGYPIRIAARLRNGVTRGTAQTEMQMLARRSALQYPQAASAGPLVVRSFLDDYVGESARALTIVSVGGVFLLLIACSNVANLVLTRSLTRQREIALRLALGATRGRVVRLLLTESLLLAFFGGVVGLGLAFLGVEFFKNFFPEAWPRLAEVTMDGWVLAATSAITLACGMICGLAPAWQIARADLEPQLRQSGRNATAIGSQRLRSLLVVSELALSLMLLIAAVLLVKSFVHLLKVENGFTSRNVLTFRLRLADAKYPDTPSCLRFLEQTKESFAHLPGVRGLAISTGFPLGRSVEWSYLIEGQPEPPNAAAWPTSQTLSVSEDYHRTLGIPVLAGRAFTADDRAKTPPVALVDEELVRRNFPGRNYTSVLGRRIRLEGKTEPWREIVGIVRHVLQNGAEEEANAQIYRPWLQMNPARENDFLRAMDFVAATNVTPATVVPSLRQRLRLLDPDQPLGSVATLDSLRQESHAGRQLNLALIGTFAASALLLSAIGLYGVMSYAVELRRREIGIRLALGANRRQILELVLRQGWWLTMTGIALGLGAALALTRLMRNLLFDVSSNDPQTFVYVSLGLALVALFATYLPARRATLVDPTVALRAE
jgi:putative ABC transport system permease protein